MQRAGTNRMFPSRRLHKALSPEHFTEHCDEVADRLQEKYAKDYDAIVAHGESTGGFQTLGIVLGGLMHVTHLSIVDGDNLQAPHGFWQSKQQWFNYRSDESNREDAQRPPDWELLPDIDSSLGYKLRAVVGFVNELANYDRLWRTIFTRYALRTIAAEQPELPARVVYIGHTATSTIPQAEASKQLLEEARAITQGPKTDFHVDIQLDRWHDDLMYPQFTSSEIMQARAMSDIAA